MISKRTMEVMSDGSTLPALSIDSEGTLYGMPPSKGVLKLGGELTMTLTERVAARYLLASGTQEQRQRLKMRGSVDEGRFLV